MTTAINLTRITIGLGIFTALWLISRRVRTFAENETELSLGARGLVVVPIRTGARVASWIFGLGVLAFSIIAVQLESSNVVILALFAGFVVAYSVNYAISRYEKTFTQQRSVRSN
jgi:hypothetical protein